MSKTTFTYVHYGWDDAYAKELDPVARLVYRSNLLGADGRITNTDTGGEPGTGASLTKFDASG